jgi:signal peptidase I
VAPEPTDDPRGAQAQPPSDPPLSGAGTATAAPPGKRRRLLPKWAIELIILLVVVLAVVFGVRLYLVQTFYIPSGSMEPTLDIGDYIVVNKLAYDVHAVHRGDIVVFRRPPSEDCGGPVVPDLVKRVIGLPGETVSGQNGQVYIDGKPLAEPWLPPGDDTAPFSAVQVPANSYFVMGDNRGDSCDSRSWGPVKHSYLVGHTILRIWPIWRLAWLGGPVPTWFWVVLVAAVAAIVAGFVVPWMRRRPPHRASGEPPPGAPKSG